MEPITRIKERLAALEDQMAAVVAESDDGSLSEEQRTKFDGLEKEHDAAKAQLADAERDAARLAKANSLLANRPQGQRKSSPDAPGGNRIEPQEPAWKTDKNRGYRNPREFLLAVMHAYQRGTSDDPRLKSLAAGADEQSTVSDPYGGFLVPEGFLPQLLTVAAEVDPTVGRTTDIPMTSPVVSIPARVDKTHTSSVSGGLRVYRRGETDTSSSSRMEVEQVKLEAVSLMGLAYATEELLSRSAISFVALLEAGFRDEFASVLLQEKLFGTGAGEFEGILNAACTVSQAKETGQAATTIVYENIVKMRSRCWGYANAVWLANHDCMPQLMLLNQTVGTGGVPVWQPSAREDHPDMLLGRPLFFSEFCETLGTVGDIYCANWSQYLVGTLGGSDPMMAESMHVRFVNNERTFRFLLYNDGRPWWRSALTPDKSSTTLSPFVTLATRS